MLHAVGTGLRDSDEVLFSEDVRDGGHWRRRRRILGEDAHVCT